MSIYQLFETGNGIKLINPENLISDNAALDLTVTRAFKYTPTATTTFTFQNPPPAGTSATFTVQLTNGGSQTINWPANVTWINGSTPSLKVSGENILRFTSNDGGVTWLGADTSSTLSRANLFTGASQVSSWIAVDSKTTNNLLRINIVNSRIIAVGASGTLTHSVDGINWTSVNVGVTTQLNAVTYGAGLYVVVGQSGVIRTSPDLVTWTVRTSGTTNTINDVIFGNGLFVAGTTNAVLTSPDGITWTSRAIPTYVVGGVAYGNNLYVAVSNAALGSTSYRTSADGITWTTRTDLSALRSPILFNAKTSQFMCVRNGSPEQIAYSSTGLPNFIIGNGQTANDLGFFATSGTTTISGSISLERMTINYQASTSGNTWSNVPNTTGGSSVSACWSDTLSAFFVCGNAGRMLTTL